MTRILFGILKWTLGTFIVSTLLAVVLFKFMPVWFTPLMFIRCYEQSANGEEMKLRHRWISLEEMPERGLTLYEASRF